MFDVHLAPLATIAAPGRDRRVFGTAPVVGFDVPVLVLLVVLKIVTINYGNRRYRRRDAPGLRLAVVFLCAAAISAAW